MKEHCRLTDREQNCQCSREPGHDGACWCTDCYISHYYAGETDRMFYYLAGWLDGQRQDTEPLQWMAERIQAKKAAVKQWRPPR